MSRGPSERPTPKKGIGIEFWETRERKSSTVTTHTSFMVDGMEFVLIGALAVIAWTLGFRLPEPPPDDKPPGLTDEEWAYLKTGHKPPWWAHQPTVTGITRFAPTVQERALLGGYAYTPPPAAPAIVAPTAPAAPPAATLATVTAAGGGTTYRLI